VFAPLWVEEKKKKPNPKDFEDVFLVFPSLFQHLILKLAGSRSHTCYTMTRIFTYQNCGTLTKSDCDKKGTVLRGLPHPKHVLIKCVGFWSFSAKTERTGKPTLLAAALM
jgi:hypothetical protein